MYTFSSVNDALTLNFLGREWHDKIREISNEISSIKENKEIGVNTYCEFIKVVYYCNRCRMSIRYEVYKQIVEDLFTTIDGLSYTNDDFKSKFIANIDTDYLKNNEFSIENYMTYLLDNNKNVSLKYIFDLLYFYKNSINVIADIELFEREYYHVNLNRNFIYDIITNQNRNNISEFINIMQTCNIDSSEYEKYQTIFSHEHIPSYRPDDNFIDTIIMIEKLEPYFLQYERERFFRY